MAARTPRRSFATPFVITLAAAPACHVQSAPPPQQPTQVQPQPQPQPDPTQPQPHPVVVNPPMPQAPSTVPANQKWTVYKAPDGSCMAALKVECQPKATCNPPPPFKYECPANVDLHVGLDTAVTVAAAPDGSACFVEYAPMKCPPNVACNPPRPTPVTCPKP